jgi:hypothetical protein
MSLPIEINIYQLISLLKVKMGEQGSEEEQKKEFDKARK